MAAKQRRPLPVPPAPYQGVYGNEEPYPSGLPGVFPPANYGFPYPYPTYAPPPPPTFDEPPSNTLRGGTLLHKGFYAFLALIPSTPSPSRLFWRAAAPEQEPIAGPRYEQIPSPTQPVSPPTSSPPLSPPTSPRNLKTRRISKDMVSKPTGFV